MIVARICINPALNQLLILTFVFDGTFTATIKPHDDSYWTGVATSS